MLTNDFSSPNVIRVMGNDIDSEMNFFVSAFCFTHEFFAVKEA